MKLVFASVFLVLGLSGCLPGNAEGYGNKPTNAGNSPTAPSMSAPLYYYEIDPHYKCVKEGEETPLPSYRESLIYSNGRAFLLGDRCHPKNFEIAIQEVTFSKTGQYVGYQNHLFLYIAEAVTDEKLKSLRPIEALCTAIDPKTENIFDIAIRRPVKTDDKLTAHVQFVAQEAITEVVRNDDLSTRTYSASEMTLRLDKSSTNYLHEAQVTSSFGSESMNQNFMCRISSLP